MILWVGNSVRTALPHASLSLSLHGVSHNSVASLKHFRMAAVFQGCGRDHTALLSLYSIGQGKSEGQHGFKRLGSRLHPWCENGPGALQKRMWLCWVKENWHKRVHYAWFFFCETLEKANWSRVTESHRWLPGAGGWWLTTKGHEGTFGDERNVSYFVVVYT